MSNARNMKVFPLGVSVYLADRTFELFRVAADVSVRKVARRHTVQQQPSALVCGTTHSVEKRIDNRRSIRLASRNRDYSPRGRKRRFEPSQARRDARRFEIRMAKVTAEAERYEQIAEELRRLSPAPLSLSVI